MKIIVFILTLMLTIPVGNVSFNNVKQDVEQQEKIYYQGAIEEMDIAETNATGDESFPTHYNTYLEAYYRGLTQNFAHNYQSSCGYVAMGMLLSYYDTYLCDDIIPEAYDVVSEYSFLNNTNMIERNNSPGILYDDFSEYGNNIDSLSYGDFFDIIYNRQFYSLYAHLLMLASNIKMPNEPVTILKSNKEGELGLTTKEERETILNVYFDTHGIKATTIRSEATTQTGLKTFIKENIDMGKPVMVAFNQGGNTGHVMVCYAHSGNTIYGHNGYLGREHDVLNGTIQDALVLEFYENDEDNDIPLYHTHSNNYEFKNGTSINKSYVCYCFSGILTYTTEYRKYEYLPGDTVIYNVPDWVTKICDNAFSNATALQTINLGDNVLEIGNFAFYRCFSLQSIKLSNSITTIGTGAFMYCTSLTIIDSDSSNPNFPIRPPLPDLPLLPIFPDQAIIEGWGLDEPDIVPTNDLPIGLEEIASNAFYNCSSLEYIIIGENVNKILNYAFSGCNSLIDAKFNDPNGWNRGVPISSEILSNNLTAAQELVTYCSSVWEKS